MSNSMPLGITAEHVRAAARLIDAGESDAFWPATGYEAVVDGRAYPPTALIGVAARIGLGLRLEPAHFSSGDGARQAFGYLRRLGFEVRDLGPNAVRSFKVGNRYSRADMQRACGLEPTRGGNWDTGYHKQGRDWFIMCMVGGAGRTGHDYGNQWEGNRLRWFGKTGSHLDQPTIQDMISEEARIHLFAREHDRDDFTYHGLVMPVEVVPVVPVEILWAPIDAEVDVVGPTVVLPDELPAGPVIEGASRTVQVSVYERDPVARRRCIAKWGCRCAGCGILMSEVYGDVADGFIHVHHLVALGEVRESHEVDPERDLRPLCPNCHAVVHLSRPMLTIEDLRSRISPTRQSS